MIPIGDHKCRFDYNILETKMKDLIKERLGDENHAMAAKRSPSQCHVFVVAKMAQHITAPPTLFRSYTVEGAPPTECPIWQAARATSAAPTIFKPMTVDIPSPVIEYIDGGLGHNNPADLAQEEAR